MIFPKKLESETEVLFGRDFLKELRDATDDDMMYSFEDRAQALIKEFGWDNVFLCWNEYLRQKCKTPEEVINFANLFFAYGGNEYSVPDPYTFLAYFYYRLGSKLYEYDGVDIMDTLVIDILVKAGNRYADPMVDPGYVPEKDPKILDAIAKYRESGE